MIIMTSSSIRARMLVLRSAILKANISVKVMLEQMNNTPSKLFLTQCPARDQQDHSNYNNGTN